MKKLSLFLLMSLFAFYGCGDDDFTDTKDGIDNEGSQEGGDENDGKNEAVISFEDLLTEPESEFKTTLGIEEGDFYKKYQIIDPENIIQLSHYYSDWGFGGGFTYTNKTDVTTPGYNNLSAITGKGKNGKVYLTSNTNSYTPAQITNLDTSKYEFKGAWVTNTTYSYLAIKDGNDGGGMVKGPFTENDWYKLTAIGYKTDGSKIGSVDFYLADFRNSKKEIINTWQWFDWSSLKNADYITFEMSSTDYNEYEQMNTPSYFCLDGITLIEK